ncbi:MAG: hypothetical protein C0501_07080 [Isosphaera sp.]|nr:hypothetical protein [Isosphaera sp.]
MTPPVSPGGNPTPPPERWVALSVRQPWAALLVAGVKTVEVRTWPTRRRGPVLIHAGRLPDERPDGWALLDTPELRAWVGLGGGVIGVADLVDCVRYDTAEAFAAAEAEHRNPPDWFRPPRLYGFAFRNPRPVAFRPFTGQTFFFPVEPAAG